MDLFLTTSAPTDNTTHAKRHNLTHQQRQSIFEALLQRSNNGKLKIGSYKVVAELFSVSIKTVARIWRRAKSCITSGSVVDVSHKYAQRVGRKRIQLDPNQIVQIPLRRRTNIRSLANALNMTKSTVHNRIKEGVIRAHSNAMKPSLTNDNKKARLTFCLSMIDNTPSSFDNPVFKSMFNYIHIDEKWFYMSKESQKYYLTRDEDEPLRQCKSKRFIPKIMFLAAVARPRYDNLGNEIFSGKIGIFPFTFQAPAQRSSKNRIAGTLETKPILSVTKDVIRACLIENVLPAIREKWPSSETIGTIFIQQDNARPHIDSSDVEFIRAASQDGFDIRLTFQPPNSPDFNVLDLGFFRAIDSLQHQEAPNTIDELVLAVRKSFDEYSSERLNKVFLSMQQCMIETMKIQGGNEYKLQHMRKERLQRYGNLPIQLECDRELIENVRSHLQA